MSDAAVAPPKPFGPLPSERQLRWHGLEYYGFLHFTVNTFTDREWGNGDESPEIFAPSALDTEQWARVAREAGMKGLIITAKHHDGFCLWPSAYTEHSVAKSPWKSGEGDILRELSDACRKNGLLFGVYLSPWDRNSAAYGTPAYLDYYRKQLRELLTRYGDVFEVWFDGANGGTGYYGGARENRRIDRKTYYDWDNTWAIVRELQPMAVMFSDAGPDIRWVGNERGVAAATCWATVRPEGVYPGIADSTRLTHGDRDGTVWRPAEVDVSIRPGWFYHAAEDGRVKTLEQLLDIYYSSVGMGCNLLLNVPPDRRGLINEIDEARLKDLHKVLALTFNEDLARGRPTTASNVRGKAAAYAPANATDGDRETYWATDDAVTTAELEVDLGGSVMFNRVRIQEQIRLGQRIEAFAVDARIDGEWRELAAGTSIGARRILRTEAVSADRVRLRITKSPVCVAVSTFELYMAPAAARIEAEHDAFMGRQQVTLSSDAPGARIYYTLDGSEPTERSPLYEGPITLDRGARVRASAWVGNTPGFPVAERVFTCYASRDELVAPLGGVAPPRGVRYAYYEGGWQTLDQLADARVVKQGRCQGFDTSVRARDEHYALVFTCELDVPADGVYTFFTESDDGSRLYVGDKRIVDNNYLQGMTERSGTIGLCKGRHPLRVEYFNATGGQGLTLRWEGPGTPKQEIPAERLHANE